MASVPAASCAPVSQPTVASHEKTHFIQEVKMKITVTFDSLKEFAAHSGGWNDIKKPVLAAPAEGSKSPERILWVIYHD